MELLEQELNDPSSPQPPPLPPRPTAMTLPSVHSASAPTIMTSHPGSTMTSRSPSNQSVSSATDDQDGAATTHEERAEPRYVSSPQVALPRSPRSAAAVANQLRANSRRRGIDRARTCTEGSTSDMPPALPQPRKFSLPFDSIDPCAGSEAIRSPSPGRQPLQQRALRQHRESPDPPSTTTRSADTSPRCSPHGKRH